MSVQTDPALREHPNRVDWNARYERAGSAHAPFAPVPWLADVLRAGVPDGPVLELASGRSGTALALAAHGRQVTAIDVSDVALLQLDSEAVRRGVADRLNLVQADLGCWEPGETRFALVLSRLFWDAAIFHRACEAVMPGGVLAWESLALSGAEAGTASAKRRVKPGEPACLLPADFTVVHEGQGNCDWAPSRIMIARRSPLPGA